MDINFDIRGNLKPYDKIQLYEDDFVKLFVDSFGKDSIRHEIFKDFSSYIQDFKEIVSKDFML